MKKLMIAFLISGALAACGGGDGGKKPAEEKAEEKKDAGSTEIANQKGLELIGASDCMTCHKLNEKNIGPAYSDVAAKYENTTANVEMLVDKVIKGGQGNWSTVPMTPHPALSKEDATEMVKYILGLKK